MLNLCGPYPHARVTRLSHALEHIAFLVANEAELDAAKARVKRMLAGYLGSESHVRPVGVLRFPRGRTSSAISFRAKALPMT